MVRDFPLFGVGLGSWPDLFPRYQSPPWSSNFYREAHNDYLELLAETGVIGFALLACFFWQGGRRLFRSLGVLSPKSLPVVAAFLSALAIMAFHEFFDFNLQIPANAFLFTLLLALALRMTISPAVDQPPSLPAPFAIAIGIIGFILLFIALHRERVPYPYNLKEPASLSEARELLLSHPARSSAHLSLSRLFGDKAPPSWQLNELETSLWLDPRNPYARDLYAALLLRHEKKAEGLAEITRSVFFSPSLSNHFYLSERLLPWLSAAEQRAVEEGFKLALASGDEKALAGLGEFYARLSRFSDEGRLYEAAALKEKKSKAKVNYLLNAALAYLRDREERTAEALFRQAILTAPEDPKPYRYLVTSIYASHGDLDMAKAVVSRGIQKGADPFSLYLSLADAAKKSGDLEEEKSALLQALDFRPSSLETLFRLGLLYLQENNFDRAATYFSKATDLDSRSANAFYHLGLAEEGRYRFFAAEKAYARAIELAPHNAGIQARHEAFKRRLEANAKKN
jgi:tetratricopeptide (TPR) repeat protein